MKVSKTMTEHLRYVAQASYWADEYRSPGATVITTKGSGFAVSECRVPTRTLKALVARKLIVVWHTDNTQRIRLTAAGRTALGRP